MRVAVCVKHVPDTAARRIDQATKRLDRAGEGALNSFDANAIEEALRIKDAQGEGEIVVVSLADLGVEAGQAGETGSRTTVRALSDPPPRGDSIKIEDDGHAADKLVEYLAGQKLV